MKRLPKEECEKKNERLRKENERLFLYKCITTHKFDGVQCVNGQTLNEESCPPLLI